MSPIGQLVLAGLVDLNQPATYLKWGFIQVSRGNLVVILVMILLFILALVLPFPKGSDES